jgi:hypothetical protein
MIYCVAFPDFADWHDDDIYMEMGGGGTCPGSHKIEIICPPKNG